MPNAVTLSAAIAAAVANTHLFDIAIERDGVGDGDESDGYGNKGGGRAMVTMAMATVTKRTMATATRWWATKRAMATVAEAMTMAWMRSMLLAAKAMATANKEVKGNGWRGQ